MRILAVRLCNLNSLRGEQPEIRFDRGPLAEAGLFAITGPMGAGKSTLLDALTLALYGRIFRFQDDPQTLRSPFGKEDIAQLMTHGTGECWAEVEFAAGGQAYLSRWQCNRARNRAEGNVQNPTMYLSELTADGTETEVYRSLSGVPERVAACTGLEFGQFVRSVLLPQGAFAQFLKAKKNTRSELLQKLTNTAHFAALGASAHLRRQEADQAVEKLKDELRLYAQQLLPAGELTGLLAQEETTGNELTRLGNLLLQAEQHIQWFADEAKLDQLLTAAEQAKTTAQAGWQAAAPLHQALERHRQADPCREAWLTWNTARQDHEKRAAEHARLGLDTAGLTDAVNAAQPAKTAAAATFDAAHQAETTRKPLLQEAEKLDLRLVEVARHLAGLVTAHTARQRAVQVAEQALADETTRQKGDVALEQELAAWLDQHRAWAQLTADTLREPRENWQLWSQAEAARLPLADQQKEDRKQLVDIVEAIDTYQKQERDHQRATEAHDRATADWQARLTHLLTSAAGHGKWLKDEATRARQLVELLEMANALAAHRARLAEVPEAMCPLCGAGAEHQHPATVQTTTDAELRSERNRATALQSRVETLKSLFMDGRALWLRHWPEVAVPTAEAGCYFNAGEEEQLAAVVAALEAEARQAQDARQRLDQAAATRAAQLAQAQKQHEALGASLLRRGDSLGDLEEQQTAAQPMLDSFLGGQGLVFAPTTVAAQLHELADYGETYRRKAQQAQLLTGQAPFRGALLAKLDATIAEAQEQATKAKNDHAALAAEVAELNEQRQARCPQPLQPTAELGKLSAATKTAADAQAEATRQLDLAVQAVERHSQRLADAALRSTEAHTHLQACAEAHRAGLLAQRLPPEADLAAWLYADLGQRDAAERQANDLHEACRDAEKQIKDLLTRQQAHGLLRPALASLAEAGAHCEELRAEHSQVQALRDELTRRRRNHDEAAGHCQGRQLTLLDLQAEAARWQELDRLIGGTNGNAFSRFAQSLTLAHLVRLANQHLARLSPRYLLLPRPDDDELGLQVLDADHVGVARAVESLSGGETFLVSLALALGLSDLAGYRVRVESLFIDEGFGTLDPDTLDLALNALETLQGQGKTIGIISHVEALKERVGTQVQVRRGAGGISTLAVVGPG